MARRLEGLCAVVTGASSGIGYAVAIALAAEGAAVVVHYNRNVDGANHCADEIRAGGGEAFVLNADVADAAACRQLVEDSCQQLGGIDVWVNVAGADILTGVFADADDLTKLRRLTDIDLIGTMQCSWSVAPVMRDRGSIVNTSWDLALRGMEGRNPEMFAAIKAGITGFTRSLARSLAPRIRVNEVAPGWIQTAFADSEMSREYHDGVIAQTPLGRFGTPEDVAAGVVYLASPDAAFVTGQTLKINGGLSS